MKTYLRLETELTSLRALHDQIMLNPNDLRLKRIKNYFESIIRCMPGNVYWMNIDGTTIGCNQNVLDMLRLENHDKFLGLTFQNMCELGGWTEDAAASFEKDTRDVLDTGIAKKGVEEPPIPVNNASNKFIYFLTTRMPVFNSMNQVIGIVGISTDITKQKEHEFALEEAKEQAEIGNRIKSEFLANMNHDIKTPLSSLISFIDIINKKTIDEDTKELANNSMQCAVQLKNLINDILEASEIEVEGISANMHRFSLGKLLSEIEHLLQLTIQIKGLQLTFVMDPNIPKRVLGYKHLLKRVLLNLVDNAIKFMSSGVIQVKTECMDLSGEKNWVRFMVIDQGPGIPANKHAAIFDQFERLAPSYTQSTPGSGLGLYIVKKYVEKMGGNIMVESEVGVGSQFIIDIPFESCPDMFEDTDDDQNQYTHSLSLKQNKIKLLLVEDNNYAQKVAALIVEPENIDLSIAKNGIEAISSCQSKKFDLIILDIGLPDLSGLEVAKRIRIAETARKAKPTPIVALTAHYDTKEYEACLAVGIQEVFSKPLTSEMLNGLIHNWVM